MDFYRVTIAHHQPISTEISTEENFSGGIKMDSMNPIVDEEQLSKLLAPSEQWPDNLPVEDLTGEVQDLMMRFVAKKKIFFFLLSCPANQLTLFYCIT